MALVRDELWPLGQGVPRSLIESGFWRVSAQERYSARRPLPQRWQTDPCGPFQIFAMDEATGSKLPMLKKGNLMRAELNEDNMVVDIGPTRVDE